MKFIFVSSQVEGRITALEKAGKSGKILAHKVTIILENLASGNINDHIDTAERYTRYGEKRIRHCRKYDLSCGYRLITLQRDDTVFIPFLGNHNECQRWLTNHSRLKKFKPGNGKTIPIAGQRTTAASQVENMEMNEDDDINLQSLTDKDLRSVFCGLVDAARIKLD